jgi:hypothetical protein
MDQEGEPAQAGCAGYIGILQPDRGPDCQNAIDANRDGAIGDIEKPLKQWRVFTRRIYSWE